MQASRGKAFINRILSHPHRVLASIFLIGFSLLALALPLLPLDPEGLDVIHSLAKPSLQHFFGTDEVGRDYFARVLYGGRVSLMVGFLSMAMSIGLGVMIGLLSGYFGGVVDFFFMRLVDVLSSIPWMILVMVFGMVFGRGLLSLVMVIGLLSWMETARIIRGEVLSLKEREYVLYARFLGIFPLRILFSHIFLHYGGERIKLSGTRGYRSDVQLGKPFTECPEISAKSAPHGDSSGNFDYYNGFVFPSMGRGP